MEELATLLSEREEEFYAYQNAADTVCAPSEACEDAAFSPLCAHTAPLMCAYAHSARPGDRPSPSQEEEEDEDEDEDDEAVAASTPKAKVRPPTTRIVSCAMSCAYARAVACVGGAARTTNWFPRPTHVTPTAIRPRSTRLTMPTTKMRTTMARMRCREPHFLARAISWLDARTCRIKPNTMQKRTHAHIRVRTRVE